MERLKLASKIENIFHITIVFTQKTAILPSFLIKSLTYIQKKEIEANAPIPIYLTTNCMEVWRKALTCHQVYRTLLLLYIPNT